MALRAKYVIIPPGFATPPGTTVSLVYWGHVPKESPAAGRLPQQNGSKTNILEGAKMGPVSGRGGQTVKVLETEQWTLVYTDGSAKQVRGWWQAGYGAWFGEADQRNVGLPVPATERQTVSTGELRGVLHALHVGGWWGGNGSGVGLRVWIQGDHYVVPQVASPLLESEVA